MADHTSNQESSGRADFYSTIRSLLLARMIIVTALLGSAIYIRVFFRVAADSFYYIIGATFILSVFYALLSNRLRHSRLFVFLQLLIDQFLISLLVLVTGGLESIFIILYYLPVVIAAVILGRLSSFLNALIAMVCIMVVAAVVNTGWVDLTLIYPFDVMTTETMAYMLGLHIVALGIVALLSGNLSSMLQRTATTLRLQTRDLLRLQAINDTIVRTISIAIFTTDINSIIRFANPAAIRLFGRNEASLLGRRIYDFLDFNEEGANVITGEQRWIREMLVKHADGHRINVSVSRSYFIDEGSERNGKLYIIQDLQELKNLQKQLLIKDRLAMAGEMSAALAHEIRNPLGAISGSAQMIRQTEELADDMRNLIDIIVRESDRLNSNLNEFLTFARQPKFSPNQTDLSQTIKETIALIRNSPQVSRAHKILLEIDEKTDLSAIVDPAMVKQMVYNIVLNGIRAMPDGGELSITVNREEDYLAIRMIDTGVGVPEDMMEQLFQPFSSRSSGGVGLGLAVVFRIMQEHGGRIHVRSSPGKGTAFIVLLPATPRDRMNFEVTVQSGDPMELVDNGADTDS